MFRRLLSDRQREGLSEHGDGRDVLISVRR